MNAPELIRNIILLALVLILGAAIIYINHRSSGDMEQVIVTSDEEAPVDEMKTNFVNFLATAVNYWWGEPTEEPAVLQDINNGNVAYERYLAFGRLFFMINWSRQTVYCVYNYEDNRLKCAGTVRRKVRFANYALNDKQLFKFFQIVIKIETNLATRLLKSDKNLEEKLQNLIDRLNTDGSTTKEEEQE